MANIFSDVQFTKPGRNTFDLTHDKKITTVMGRLTPVLLVDTVPGDFFKIMTNVLVRFAPLVAPIMHRVSCYVHFFYCPNRLVWPKGAEGGGWENFITGGEDGLDDTVWPYFEQDLSTVAIKTLNDYLGLPCDIDVPAGSQQYSAIPHAVYQLIYNEYYRDENLIDNDWQPLADGDNTALGDWSPLRKRAWQHDYFTSSLPWLQRGAEAMLPLGSVAPVYGYSDTNPPPGGFPTNFRNSLRYSNNNLGVQGEKIGVSNAAVKTDNSADSGLSLDGSDPDMDMYLDLNGTNYADLSAATAASINDLRRAMRLQEWLEKNARGGSRYFESNLVHFGVRSPDASLQRPEYLGGMQVPVKISEILQTSTPTDSYPTPQGNMSGHGLSVGGSRPIKYFCKEHGYIMGIMSIMPMSAYQQGVPRHFLRSDKFDYFWPSFQHIGEQPVRYDEIMGNTGTTPDLWGYVPRYAEYKYINNSVHGDFRQSLDRWHLGRKFDTVSALPELNQEFIELQPEEINRIFAVDDPEQDNMWCHVLNQVQATRPMAVYGNPG